MRNKILIVFIFVVAAMHAFAQSCPPEQAVAEWAKRQAKPYPLRVAAFDHVAKRWHAYLWEGGVVAREITDATFDVPHTNEPTMYVRRGEHVAVVVMNTNPLLYAANVTASSEANIEGFDALKDFAALFGGIGQVEVGRLAKLAIPAAPIAMAERVDHNVMLRQAAIVGGNEQALPPLPPLPPLEELRVAARVLTEDLQGFATAKLEKDINAAVAAGKDADKAIKNLDISKNNIVIMLQRAEAGTADPLAIDPTTLAGLVEDTRMKVESAHTAVAKIAGSEPTCTTEIANLDEALRMAVRGLPADAETRAEVRKKWFALLGSITGVDVHRSCDAYGLQIDTLAEELAKRFPARDLTPDEKAIASAMRDVTTAYIDLATKWEKAVTADGKLDEKLPGAVKLAEQLEKFGNVYSTALNKNPQPATNCWLTAGVVEVERIENNELKLPWYKVRTEGFAINLATPLAEGVETTRAGELTDRKVSLGRSRVQFGVDTALIFTGAEDREYAAAAFKETADENGNTKTGEDIFVIREKSRTSRTGKLALMLTLSPAQLHGLGAQIGFGTSTDDPAVFAGLSYTIAKFMRISAGGTQQRVTRLENGFQPGAYLNAADDLATKESRDSSWYAAIAFTLSDLPIFKQ